VLKVRGEVRRRQPCPESGVADRDGQKRREGTGDINDRTDETGGSESDHLYDVAVRQPQPVYLHVTSYFAMAGPVPGEVHSRQLVVADRQVVQQRRRGVADHPLG